MIYADDQVVIETKEDLQTLLDKYDCETVNELEDALWFVYGITIVNKLEKR